ncbi:hypothetical protein EDD37DRAFT_673546 [Exophiala viscosa]|uniref:Nephrocystin 3-like N-terminal domain-containing protein n=1 Tax=Exophiala viscosa TaxID=2486360 RepID=A0AAN6I9N9_9EURO|nr:hypothetical protein EDD36DRAFT_422718 [Exophiala viscosa]KAI1620852.1 hypothetical protein EDD37DRAFT_673546 [Exophiala viscosa]
MSSDIQGVNKENTNASRRIHVKECGFTIVHDGGPRPDFDIVFIHGIQGYPLKTWTYNLTQTDTPKPKGPLGLRRSIAGTPLRDRSAGSLGYSQDVPAGFWPANLLRKDFPDARILTYGYDSQVSNFFSGGANQNNIIEIANAFLNDLAAQRVDARGRDMIIVSHSMGGLITKEALRRASNSSEMDSDLKDVLLSTFALIFFGTPHRGGAYTNLGLTIAKMAKAAGFSVNDQNIRDLRGDSPVLALIRDGFSQLLESGTFYISTFQESLGYSGFGWMDSKVVPNESSELGHPVKERKSFVNANHRNMCRFQDEDDDGYIRTKGEIKRHLERRKLKADHIRGEQVQSQLPAWNLVLKMFCQIDLHKQVALKVFQNTRWVTESCKSRLRSERRCHGSIKNLVLGSTNGLWQVTVSSGYRERQAGAKAMKFLLENYQTLSLLNQSLEVGSWLLLGSFFTDRAERIQASWEGILHDMIYQLLDNCPALMDIAYGTFVKRRQSYWDTNSLEKLLLTIVTEFDGEMHVCFLIDALDEHDGQHGRMSDFFHDLVASSRESVQLKVVVASRPHNEIKDLFEGDQTLEMQEWTEKDIKTYITVRLARQPRWQALKDRGAVSTVSDVEADISKRAQGVFLWVKLVIDELVDEIRDGVSIPELKEWVRKFPEYLDDLFGHMLQKVKKQHYMELVIVVETLLRSEIAPTPEFLRLVVLANSKADNNQANEDDSQVHEEIDPDGIARRLRSRSGGLVEIVPRIQYENEELVVQFVHQIVKEYFLRRKNLSGFSESITCLAPGVDHLNGCFFILQAYLYWLKMPPKARMGYLIDVDELARAIVSHAIMTELSMDVAPTRLLGALDPLISQQSRYGLLWPLNYGKAAQPPEWLKESEVAIQYGSMFMIEATAFRLSRYIQEALTDEMAESIRASGAIQFGYLRCGVSTHTRGPLLDRANLLIKCGVNVSLQRTFRYRDPNIALHAWNQAALDAWPLPTISMDALGIFVSTHWECCWGDGIEDDTTGHMAVLRRLLEVTADPMGLCLIEEVPIRLDRYFSMASLQSQNIRMLDLSWEQCKTWLASVADMFDTTPSHILWFWVYKSVDKPEIARWLLNHGATISAHVAMAIYQPLAIVLSRRYRGVPFVELVQAFAAEGKSLEVLEQTLLGEYERYFHSHIMPGYKLLLATEFRKPQYYEADAREFASE